MTATAQPDIEREAACGSRAVRLGLTMHTPRSPDRPPHVMTSGYVLVSDGDPSADPDSNAGQPAFLLCETIDHMEDALGVIEASSLDGNTALREIMAHIGDATASFMAPAVGMERTFKLPCGYTVHIVVEKGGPRSYWKPGFPEIRNPAQERRFWRKYRAAHDAFMQDVADVIGAPFSAPGTDGPKTFKPCDQTRH